MKSKPALFVLVFFMISSLYSQCKSSGILFLEFKFENRVPQLIKTTLTKGKLKTGKIKRNTEQALSFDVVSKKNNVLFNTTAADPASAVYEYPGENGEIKRTEVKQDSKTVTIRIPYSTSIDKVILYRNKKNLPLLKTTQKAEREKFEFSIDPGKIIKE